MDIVDFKLVGQYFFVFVFLDGPSSMKMVRFYCLRLSYIYPLSSSSMEQGVFKLLI